jgi:hypothetical protein
MKYTKAVELYKNWNLKKQIWNDLWQVETSFVWFLDYNNRFWEKIIIKKWFITNFGSIPRLFWCIFDKNKYVAYILHDWLLNERWKELIKKLIKKYKRPILLDSNFYIEGQNIKIKKDIEKLCNEIKKIEESIQTEWKKYNRFQADWILFKAMKVEWATLIERLLVYIGISIRSILKILFNRKSVINITN